MTDETETVTGAAATKTGTPKGNIVSRVLDLLHTAEAHIAADEAALAAFLKAEIHRL